jgi:hypothetical protein
MTAKMTATATDAGALRRTASDATPGSLGFTAWVCLWGSSMKQGIKSLSTRRLREDQRVSLELGFMTQPSQGVSARIRESPRQGVK